MAQPENYTKASLPQKRNSLALKFQAISLYDLIADLIPFINHLL